MLRVLSDHKKFYHDTVYVFFDIVYWNGDFLHYAFTINTRLFIKINGAIICCLCKLLLNFFILILDMDGMDV